jgi:cytochrome c553
MLLAAIAVTASLASARAPAADTAAPDPMAEHVRGCTPCHGVQGGGTDSDYFPRLAGKPAGYLLNQLIAFRDGRRKYAPMNYLLEYQPDAYLKQIADYFAAQRAPLPPRPAPETTKEILARGQAIVTGGDPQHEIPACQGCHGPTFTGMEPAIPALVGLRAGYISAQLGAWRYGTRTAAQPDCMQVVAGHLTENDVRAVAAWLSSLPIPADPSPAKHGSLPMPLGCGSEP